MTKKEFLKRVTNSQGDFLAEFVGMLKQAQIPFCIVGGLAVNAYAEPVVSLDLDVVLATRKIPDLIKILRKRYTVHRYAHSVNISAPDSDLRIQIQTDPGYQVFIKRARVKDVLGYRLPVARLEDVFQGKIWAAIDPQRRASKRHKDLADIQRLIERTPRLAKMLPDALKKLVNRLSRPACQTPT